MAQGIVNIVREWLFGPVAPPREVFCVSCETLKEQLAFANYDRKVLLETVLRASMADKLEDEPSDTDDLQPINNTKYTPWKVRQQQLESASREKARLLRPEARPDAPRVVTPESIEKLETELGIGVEDARETVRENS